jgi:curved DNA-binding protein CbpA
MSGNFDTLGYYEVLEVTPNASLSQIKTQYYDRAKFWHPDHNENPKALEIFQKISVAYNILKDQKTRLRYDLLSIIYDKEDFPEISSLKIYKNQKGKDDNALRVLKQKKVTAYIGGYKIKETKDICNYKEAKDMVISTSIHNWLYGWWNFSAFLKNINAIKFNLEAVNAEDKDNLKLLIHNMLAYEQDNNKEMSWVYAKQAYLFAEENSRLQELLTTYIDILDYHPQKVVSIPYWQSKELRRRQFIIPYFFILILATIGISFFGKMGLVNIGSNKNKSYYSEISVNRGMTIADDQVESKIIKVDGDIGSKNHLYHLKNDVKIYYGPDDRYDVLVNGKKGQTVRITGYTPDKKWYKVMIDNGENGYVRDNMLKKGIGNPLPPKTKIYR